MLKEQYAAAAKAIHVKAEEMISHLNFFEQAPARAALTDDLVHSFAKVAVDAALAVKPAATPAMTTHEGHPV